MLRTLYAVLALEAGVVLLETVPAHRPGLAPPPPPALPPTARVQPSAPSPAQTADHILARPLFTPGRRPPAAPQAVLPRPEPLPRLTGIVVTQLGRQAIFAPLESPVRLSEGGHIGPFTIKAITPDTVELQGPLTRHTLRPAPDPTLRTRLAYAAPPVPFLDPYRRELETENDQ